MNNYFKFSLVSAALALGACADQMPTTDATRTDRIILMENSTLAAQCRAQAPEQNPDLTPWDITERCKCHEKHMVDNLDGRIAAWAVQHRDWATRTAPAWILRRQDVSALAAEGFKACGLIFVKS